MVLSLADINFMKKVVLLILIYFIPMMCMALEEVQKVNLQQAIDITVENNIDLKASYLEEAIAKNNIKIANRLQNPDFNAFYFLGAAGRSEPNQLGFSELIEIGKRGVRKNLAKANLELVLKNVDYRKFSIEMDVREAYVNLVAAKSVLDTMEQQQELQEELLEIAQRHVKSGFVPEIDAIQATIALNQMITQVNTAKANVKSALFEFNKIINSKEKIFYDSIDKVLYENNNFEELMTPLPTTKFPDFDLIAERALENRYDIKIAKQEIEVAKQNLKVIMRKRVPDLELVGGYAYQTMTQTDDRRYNSGAYVGGNIVNLPVFYNYAPEIKNAKLQLEQAELNYESVKNRAIKDLNAAYYKLMISAANLNDYETKILTSSEKLIDLSVQDYETGKSDLTSLIVMKQSYKSIIVGYTMALAEYYNSWTNFLREVNSDEFDLFTGEVL